MSSPVSRRSDMPPASNARPPPLPRRSQRTRKALPSSPALDDPRTEQHSSQAAFVRALQGRTLNIPHAMTRFSQQLKYIENLTAPGLREHIPSLRKLFLSMLTLQVKLPSSFRFHFLLESEHPKEDSSEFTNIDLFSIFSSTVLTETSDRRKSVSILGELLVDFKMMCNAEGSSTVPAPGQRATQAVNDNERDSSRPAPISNNNDIDCTHNHDDGNPSVTPQSEQENAQSGSDDDTPESTAKHYVPTESIINQVKLPHWFPDPMKEENEYFTDSVLTVDIDCLHKRTYDQAVFVYGSLIRAGHNLSLQNKNKAKYEDHEHFKSVFSFIPFKAPWFVGHIDFHLKGKPVFDLPLTFSKPFLPTKRENRRKSPQVIVQLQGLISSFYKRDPLFAVKPLDFLIHRSLQIFNQPNPIAKTPSTRNQNGSQVH